MLASGIVGLVAAVVTLVTVQATSIIRKKPPRKPTTYGCLPIALVLLLVVMYAENPGAALVGFFLGTLAWDLIFETRRWRSFLLRKRDEWLG